jgi:hypothetical protein
VSADKTGLTTKTPRHKEPAGLTPELTGHKIGVRADPARLLKIDAGSGKVSEERVLGGNVWSIAVEKIPARLLPHGEVQARHCDDRSQQAQSQ